MASARFRINGGGVGVKASVSASGAVTATLDSTDGVRSTQWFIDSTDDLSAPGNYVLTPSGSVNQTVSTTALTAGTAAKLRARINGGNDVHGRPDPANTNATAKFFVPTVLGREVGCAGEEFESDATNGSTGIINGAVRDTGGVSFTDVNAALATANAPVDINGQALTDCGGVKLRNDAGSGTIDGLHRDAGNFVRVGENTNALGLRLSTSASGFIDCNFNGTAALRVTSTALTFQTAGASNIDAPAALTISADTGAGGSDLIFKKSGAEKLRIVSGGLQIEKGYVFSVTQPQSTSGAGRDMTFQAQRGVAGTDGADLVLAAGDAGTVAVNLQGDVVVELGKSGDEGGFFRLKAGAHGEFLSFQYGATLAATAIAHSKPYEENVTGYAFITATDDVQISCGGGAGDDLRLRYGSSVRLTCDATTVSFFSGAGAGSGDGVLSIKNATTAPTTNPTGGGLLYAEGGAGKWRSSGGTTTTFGTAEPHCPRCGADFAHQWSNGNWHKRLTYCAICLVTTLEGAGVPVNQFVFEREGF